MSEHTIKIAAYECELIVAEAVLVMIIDACGYNACHSIRSFKGLIWVSKTALAQFSERFSQTHIALCSLCTCVRGPFLG